MRDPKAQRLIPLLVFKVNDYSYLKGFLWTSSTLWNGNFLSSFVLLHSWVILVIG